MDAQNRSQGGEAMRIGNTGEIALKILDNMSGNNMRIAKSIERLSTGLKINSAADDIVGMARSQRMESEIRGLRQAVRNVETAKDMAMTADGTLGEVQSVIQRMRELAVYAASDSLADEDREYIQFEIEQLTEHVNNLIGNSRFNTIKLFKEDALSYFGNSAISQLTSDKAETEKLRNAISDIMDKNLVINDTYETIFDLLEKFKSEKEQNGESLPSYGPVTFDKNNVSLKILKIDDIDLSTLEKTAANVERVNSALSRVMSYVAEETVNETDIAGVNAALDSNVALNSAFRSVFYAFEQLAENESDEDDSSAGDELAELIAAESAKGISSADRVSEDILNIRTLLTSLSNSKRQTNSAPLGSLPNNGFVPGNIFCVQSGANEGETLAVDLGLISVQRIGIGVMDMSTRDGAAQGITTLDNALDAVSSQRAMIGAQISGMNHRIDYLENSATILEEARSRLTEADIADEMMIYTKLTLANQIGNIMLKQVALMQKRALDLFL
jgi:flagellin